MPRPRDNVRAVAKAKGLDVSEVTVVVLERDRHESLIRELRETGARVNLIRDGDVAPSIAAAQAFAGVDMLMGIGGTPEGVISAAAIKCLRGAIQGKLWPRNDEERQSLIDAGVDLDRVLTTDDLVSGDDVFVAATGVTSGVFLRGVRVTGPGVETESIVMRSRSGTVRRIAAYHPSEKVTTTDERKPRWPRNELHETARALVADNKGILAADESSGTIKKRFDSIELESTEESRRAYRDMLFTTAGLEEYVSGVILYDETLRQASADGTPFAKLLADRGIIPGIKVDTRRQGTRVRARREGDGGPRRPARAAAGVQEPRRPLRQVARRDHDRRGDPERVLPRGRTPTRWRATRPSARSRGSSRSSSRRC